MRDFIKMHGLGNDFVIVDRRHGAQALGLEERRLMANRRWGIGCDQLLVLETPELEGADVFMRIFNPDGSEAEACGNGTRCVAALVMDEMGRDAIGVETVAGLLLANRAQDGLVTIDMGPAGLDWQTIPLAREMDTAALELDVAGYTTPVAVNMGNPHVIFVVDDADAVPLETVGPQIENDPLFPERTNVEFISKKADGGLRMRVWERSAGITQACGSGACASLVAAVRRGLIDGRRAPITLDGGDLILEWRESDGHVLMTGPVSMAFHGVWQS